MIGKAGGTIKGMQQRTGSNIQIPQNPDADDPSRRTITISAATKGQVRPLSSHFLQVFSLVLQAVVLCH